MVAVVVPSLSVMVMVVTPPDCSTFAEGEKPSAPGFPGSPGSPATPAGNFIASLHAPVSRALLRERNQTSVSVCVSCHDVASSLNW